MKFIMTGLVLGGLALLAASFVAGGGFGATAIVAVSFVVMIFIGYVGGRFAPERMRLSILTFLSWVGALIVGPFVTWGLGAADAGIAGAVCIAGIVGLVAGYLPAAVVDIIDEARKYGRFGNFVGRG